MGLLEALNQPLVAAVLSNEPQMHMRMAVQGQVSQELLLPKYIVPIQLPSMLLGNISQSKLCCSQILLFVACSIAEVPLRFISVVFRAATIVASSNNLSVCSQKRVIGSNNKHVLYQF